MSELTSGFQNVLNMIISSREIALKKINEELILLHWRIQQLKALVAEAYIE